MPKNLYLIRHFKTDAPKEAAFYGSTDLPIIDRPEAESLRLKIQRQFISLFTPVSSSEQSVKLFSSPMLRCQQTAKYFFAGSKPLLLPKAVEVDFGRWEGQTFTEIAKADPELVEAWQKDEDFTFPEGESLKVFQQRIEELASELAECKEDNLILVCHGGVIRHLICYYLGLSYEKALAFEVKVASLTQIKLFDAKNGVLVKLNDCD